MPKARAIIDMSRQAFQTAFQMASKAVSYKKGGGPENNVLIRTDAQEGVAFFYGTNLETAIRHRAACETAETHVVMFDQQLVQDLLSASDGPRVTITWGGRHNYTYTCGATTAEFRTADPENFPLPRVKHDPVLSFTGERFRTVARQIDVVNSGDRGGFRLFRNEAGELWFESFDQTGGFAHVRLGDFTVLDDSIQPEWIMLNKSVKVAADVFGDKAESVILRASKDGELGTVILDGEDTTVIVRLFAANWPPMYRVFEQPLAGWIETERKELQQGLQLMQVLSDLEFRGGATEFVRFYLEMRPDGATAKTYNKGGKHESERVMEITRSQLEGVQGYLLSASYMLAAINSLKVKKVKVGLVINGNGQISGCSVSSDEDPRVEWRFPGFNMPVVEEKKA